MKSYNKIIGLRLKELRKAKDLNLNEFSFLTNLQVKILSKAEQGHFPKLHELLEILECLNVTLTDIIPEYVSESGDQINKNVKTLSKNQSSLVKEIIYILIEHIKISSCKKDEVMDLSLIGKRIREIRLSKNMSVNRICEMTGIPYRVYHPIELGKVPRIETIEKIANAMGILTFEILIDYFYPYKFLLKRYFPEIKELNDLENYECKFIYRIMTELLNYL